MDTDSKLIFEQYKQQLLNERFVFLPELLDAMEDLKSKNPSYSPTTLMQMAAFRCSIDIVDAERLMDKRIEHAYQVTDRHHKLPAKKSLKLSDEPDLARKPNSRYREPDYDSMINQDVDDLVNPTHKKQVKDLEDPDNINVYSKKYGKPRIFDPEIQGIKNLQKRKW